MTDWGESYFGNKSIIGNPAAKSAGTDWTTLGASVVNAIGSAVGGYLGYKGQQETNAMTKELNDKQIALQHAAWAREDNAVQRRMADLKAAGLSPTLAAGNAAAASAPSVHLKNQESGLDKLGAGFAQAANSIMTYYQIKAAKNQDKIDKENLKTAKYNADIAQIDAEQRKALAPIESMDYLERFGINKENREHMWLTNQMTRKDYNNYDVVLRIREKTLQQLEKAIEMQDWKKAEMLYNMIQSGLKTGAEMGYRGAMINLKQQEINSRR